QADGVAGHRVAEARVEFLRHRRAADDAAPFEHAHLQPGAGEVGGADQAVVAAADDQYVAIPCRHVSVPCPVAASFPRGPRATPPPAAGPSTRRPPPPAEA